MSTIDLEMNNNVGQNEVQSISLHSQLYWRSALGMPAAWSGSSSRGVYLMDDDNKNGGSSLIQNIIVDKRMLRLPTSLRDVVVQNLLSTDVRTPNHRHRRGNTQSTRRKQTLPKSNIQLLSHPRIVGSAQSTIGSSTFFSTNNNRANNGISCMDIDNGNDDTITGSPSRYLLVGSSGGDCTIALYDLSYFGSDGYLYQQQQSTSNNNISSQPSTVSSSLASVTHRPIAKSIRHQSSITSTIEEDASAVPSGHKHPLLGCKWYPGDVKQMFVSASISGEILIWDVSNFVPVFATYAHIYTGISRFNNDNDDNGGKTVSPLQCMDLPKTPESCPNGNALLALGLGSSGRGVIQLCDAFRGGSATHEFVGHNGGVNSVLWDPYHPFRLASGGDDCTIRLWDIRKAGSAACLGILNRENEMFSGVGDVSSVNDDDYSTVIRKKQRASLSTTNNIRTASGIESHGSPVTALAFAPGGDDLVSTGLDGKIQHWDLRPDSCFVSSIDAITSGKSSRDPSVATGGRLYPTSFTDGSNNNRTGLHNKASSKRRRSYHYNKPSLAIMQPGSRSTTTLISTSSNNNASSRGQITGYSLFGRRGKEPGCCDFTLNGHLSDVTCLLPITKAWDNLAVNSRSTSTNHTVSFLTGGLDGMVLSWGSSRRRQYTVSSTDSIQSNDISSNNMPQYSSSAHHAEQPSEDLDNW